MWSCRMKIACSAAGGRQRHKGGTRCLGQIAAIGQEQMKRAQTCVWTLEFLGSPTRARTWDLRINSPSLYRLSYRGTAKKRNYSINFRVCAKAQCAPAEAPAPPCAADFGWASQISPMRTRKISAEA